MKSEEPAIAIKSESLAKPAWSKKYGRKTGTHGVVGDGMSGSACSVNQGDLSCARKSRAGVRVPVVAMKRLTTVEPRGAGKWKREGNTTANQTAGSAERG